MPKENEVSANKAAQISGVNLQTIVRHIKSGNIPARKRLNQYRIKESDLQAWMQAQGLTA